MIIEEICSPNDLKDLNLKELTGLSQEIRNFLISELSQTGGHLASNLGVVELTVALHKVYNTPSDKIIWDVGHQSYIHKILTGRREDFKTLRQLDGLSGFPKSSESVYDAFDTGHSSTSISVALGLCAARDLLKQNHNVVAVVGDGSMTGGLVYEALNNAGRSNTDLLVVLNDNQMSIAQNVGAVSRHLNDIRTAPTYRGAKRDVHKLLEGIPRLGKRVDKWIESAKDVVKYMLVPGVLFEEMGFQYYGPIDGHDLKTLIHTMQNLQTIKGPVLLHVVTTKGKGYPQAEQSPDAFHMVGSFQVETGRSKAVQNGDTYTDVFGQTMVDLADKRDNLVAITAAMPDGTGLCAFQKKYPKRFYDVGIAESHAVTFAAGMAKGGAIPVTAIYSSFIQRAYDQILHDVCIQNLHVVLAIDRAGLVGPDGETHQGIFDLSFLSHMPNMTIMSPKNRWELADMLNYAVLRHKGPIAIRYPKGTASLALKNYHSPIEYGKSETLFEGQKIAIVSVGAMMDTALTVVKHLRDHGYNPALFNARFIKPVDKDLAKHLLSYQHVFILEDNVQAGGYGERLLEETVRGSPKLPPSSKNSDNLGLTHKALPLFHLFAFPDQFIEQGTREELFRRYGMDGEGAIRRMLKILG